MHLKFFRGYYTIFSGRQPVLSFATLAAALMMLNGCATIREHPVATSIVVALAAGSIAASQNHDNRVSPHTTASIGTPGCANPAVCQ